MTPHVERLLQRLDRTPLHHLVLAGLIVRVAWIAVCPNAPYSDQSVYHFEAQMIGLGRGYVDLDGHPTNYYPVGYPALLGTFYAVFGPRYIVAYGLNLVLALVGISGAYKLGALLFGERTGKLAALIVAIYPTFILMTTAMASENPFCAALPWALWLLVRATREPRTLWLSLAAGAVVAAMSYVRPPALLLLSCPVVFGLLERRPTRRWITSGLVALAAALVVLSPWGMRNQRDFGKFSLTSFNAGINLYAGNNPDSTGEWMEELPADTEFMSEPDADRALAKRGKDYVLAHPARYVALSLNRLYLSMRSDTIAPVWDRVGISRRFGKWAVPPLKVVCSLFHWALLLVLLSTLWRAGRRKLTMADRELAWAALLIAVPFVLIIGGNRYVLPLMMLVCVWASSIARAAPVSASAMHLGWPP